VAQAGDHFVDDLACAEERPKFLDAHAAGLCLVLVGQGGREKLFWKLPLNVPARTGKVLG